MVYFYPLLFCATFLAIEIASLAPERGLWYSSRTARSAKTLRRQITSLKEATNTSAVSSDPALDGLAVHIDPTADYATWFPQDSDSTDENGFATSKRGTTSGQTFSQVNSLTWTNDTTGTDYNFTFSGCASKGDRVLGYWTFDNGTETDQVTWFDILNDAKAGISKYHSVDAALDAGILRNIDATQYNISLGLGVLFYDDTGDTLPPNTTNGGLQAETSQDLINYDYNVGRIELRRLLDSDWLPTWRAVIFVAVGTALHYGVITGFNIIANVVVNGNNYTAAAHVYGAGAALTFLLISVLGWVLSPKLRSTINRLTASGAVAAVRERSARVVNTALNRAVGDEESAIVQPAADAASLPGSNSVLSSNAAVQPGIELQPQVLENLPQQPLSNLQRVGSWMSTSSSQDLGVTSFSQALETVEEQSGGDFQC